MSLRICIVGTAYPYKGGIAMFNERLARELISEGHQVDVVTFTLQYPKFFFPGESQYSDDLKPSDLSIERKINSINPISWITTARKINKGNYNLVITRYWIPALSPCLGSIMRLVKSKSTKILSIVDNIIPHEKRVGDNLLSKFFVKSIDGFIVMSKKVENQMQAFISQQPMTYVPHPIYDTYGDIIQRNSALEYLGLDKELDYVLFFGYIRDYKGLDILIDAMALAIKENPKLRLIIAGEYYSDKEKYLSQIEKLKMQDYVILHTKYISNDEVKYFFCGSDIVAQTYKSATQSGISQIAIYFEKPIISTDVGGLPETIIDNRTGYLTTVDVVEISYAISNYFKEKPLERLKFEIKKLKKQYSWSHFISELETLAHKIKLK